MENEKQYRGWNTVSVGVDSISTRLRISFDVYGNGTMDRADMESAPTDAYGDMNSMKEMGNVHENNRCNMFERQNGLFL
jgi:hypothetical protein